MSLSVETMQRIMREVVLDLPHRLKTKEANEWRRKIAIDIADILRQGYIPDWKPEIDLDDDPEQD